MLRKISLGCLWLFLLIIAIAMLSDQRSVSTAAPDVDWQFSQAPVAKLGVRDKLGSLGKYTAVWIVSAPDGTQYQTKTKGESYYPGYVYFPDDFHAFAQVGRYSWKCFVDGQEVVRGSFEFAQNGLQLTVIHPF